MEWELSISGVAQQTAGVAGVWFLLGPLEGDRSSAAVDSPSGAAASGI